MKIRNTLLLLSCSYLISYERVAEPIHPEVVFRTESERLEFSQEESQYFSEELPLPSVPLTSSQPVKAEPSNVKITTAFEAKGWKITFVFPEKVTFKQELDPNSIYLEFNQGIDSPDLITVQDKLSFLIKKFANGFNTLYLVGKRPLLFSTKADQNTFIIEIYPDAPAEPTKASKIACARLLIERRSYREARSLLNHLAKEYPGDPDVVMLQASLEGLENRWQKQVAVLRELKDQNPDDEDARKQYYEAYFPHSSFIGVQGQQQTTLTLASVQAYRLPFEVILSSGPTYTLYGGLLYQIWHGDIKSINDLQGNSVPFHGVRNQGAVYLRNEWASGVYLKGIGYIQQMGIPGGGLETGCLVPFIDGGVSLTLDWHRPYWDLFETLAFAGRQDRVKLSAFSNPSRYFNWTLSAGLDRIGIEKTRTALTDALLNFDAFLFLTITNPSLAFNYAIDADYVLFDKEKIAADGITEYNPVPLVSYEFHSIRLYLFYNWRQQWFFTLYGGETFDRYSVRSPTIGIDVKYIKALPQGWEIELSADRFPSQQIVGAAAIYVTGTITYRF